MIGTKTNKIWAAPVKMSYHLLCHYTKNLNLA